MRVARLTAVVQGKGGVGKTSVTANVSGLAALAGLRVLVVDLDPQGNLARDLGMPLDSGNRLLSALISGGDLPVVPNVRVHDNGGHLDVVPGGPEVSDLSALMQSRADRVAGSTLALALGNALNRIADDYDLLMVDTPPGERVLVEGALGVASAVVIPTRADDASLDGLSLVAKRFVTARETNPDLRLAGVVLFGFDTRATRLQAAARASIEGILGGAAPIFEATIRHSDTAAVDARREGLLTHELEGAVVRERRKVFAALREHKTPVANLFVKNATGLASDYESVTGELLDRLTVIEQEITDLHANDVGVLA